MRWIFLLLLLLNVGLFVWQQRPAPAVPSELSLLQPDGRGGAVQALELLSETRAVQPANEVPAPPPAPLQAITTGESGAHCLMLGGFDSLQRAEQLQQRLLSLDIAVRVVSAEASFGADHWVYIPPLASSQASLRQLRELQARKIDSYLITEGELANGILLGVFPRLDSALSIAEKVRTAGYEPQVRELPRIYQVHWVRVSAQAGRLIDDAMLARLSMDFPDLKHQLISCQGVAHE